MQHTPWGASQDRREIAPGIVRYDTASHGGIHLDAARWRQFRKLFPTVNTWAGDQWLEEDCDWALAALAFPEHFDARSIFHAVRTIQDASDYLAEPRAWLTNSDAGRALVARADAYTTTGEPA